MCEVLLGLTDFSEFKDNVLAFKRGRGAASGLQQCPRRSGGCVLAHACCTVGWRRHHCVRVTYVCVCGGVWVCVCRGRWSVGG